MKEDGDNFYKLNLSILDKIGIFNDNIIDTLKEIFIGIRFWNQIKIKIILMKTQKNTIFLILIQKKKSEIFDKEKKKDIID